MGWEDDLPFDPKQHIRDFYRRLFTRGQPPRLPVTRGRDLAIELNYPVALLAPVSSKEWDCFHPCGNPLPLVAPTAEHRVLNLGSGIGIDSLALLLAAERPSWVVNLDLIWEILQDSRALAHRCGITPAGCTCITADLEHLPLAGETFDWLVLNGVLNLFAEKSAILGECHRLLRRSGRLVITDLCAAEPVTDYFRNEPDAWAWCLSGAETEDALMTLLREAGFTDLELRHKRMGEPFYPVSVRALKGN
jgi:SAM-dependent methyltransferase